MFKRLLFIGYDFGKQMSKKNISAFASSTAFFLFLSLIPALMLLCAILPYTPLTEANLMSAANDITPDAMDALVTGIIAGGDKAIRTAVEGAEDNFELGEEDAKILTAQDVCVVISASGNPKYLLGVLAQADRVNCRTIALTCNHKALILEEAGLGICVEVGPEVIAGSSRMKAC